MIVCDLSTKDVQISVSAERFLIGKLEYNFNGCFEITGCILYWEHDDVFCQTAMFFAAKKYVDCFYDCYYHLDFSK